jgi:hypothetical protein
MPNDGDPSGAVIVWGLGLIAFAVLVAALMLSCAAL